MFCQVHTGADIYIYIYILAPGVAARRCQCFWMTVGNSVSHGQVCKEES